MRNPGAGGTSPRGKIYPLETQQQPEERRALSQGGGEMAGAGGRDPLALVGLGLHCYEEIKQSGPGLL